jgi:D-alanyl-D-alanine carboxypeptidase
MMTALVAVERIPEGRKVRITRQALNYRGSGVGMFKRGRWIGINTMLYGLLLPSGNDAAIALAQKAGGGTVRGFVQRMNEKASELGLTCSRFSNPDGFVNRGNHSCAADLAAIGRAVMREPRLRRIVGRRSAVLPFPTRGGKLYLYNHNPLLRAGYRGTTGIKTGYTVAAGRCLVATVERGGVRLGVVLLHSPDPGRQARHLLDRGFAAIR